MTSKTISVLFIITVLMTSVAATSMELIPNADALKSKGNYLTVIGSSAVCGDKLCSEVKSQSSMTKAKMQPHLSNVNLPLDIPLTMGYVDGNEVFYISTEASVEGVANHLTDLTGFRVVYTPALEYTPEESLAQIYAFTNGVKGNGAFGFQPQVADSQPGDKKYSPLWNVNAVTWNEGLEPRELKSEMEILDAKSNGELSFEDAGVVVNCPFIKWNGGQLQLRENSHVSNDDPYGGGQVTNIDLENMKVTFVAHRGFAPNGDTIYYIATDTSSKDVADALGIVYAPRIQETIATASSSDLYVFTNGLDGNGPLGFQASIGSTTTGDKFYSPLWRIQTVTWDNPESADFLKTVSEISQAASRGKLETGLAGFVVNCPFVEVNSMVMKDNHMMDDKMMDDKMMDDKMMDDKMMDDKMMDDKMMDDKMMDDKMMDDKMMDDKMMDDKMMDDKMMDDKMMDDKMMDDKMMDDKMMDDKMMDDKMMDDKMMDDKMMDDKMMDDKMMDDKMMDDKMMDDKMMDDKMMDDKMMDDKMMDDKMMDDKMMDDKMMDDKMMDDKMMDDKMMDDKMMDDKMMDDKMMDDKMMDDKMMDDKMMDDKMMDDKMMDDKMMDDKMMDDKMMDDKMMDDKMMDDKMMDDKMMDDKMMDDKMMDDKMMMSDSSMKGDLTAPSGDAPFGGKFVGTFSISVDNGDHITVTTYIKNTSSGMVQEGWLVDMDSGYKLSLGKSNDNGKLSFSQQMINPWIYDAIVITEEPIGDFNPAPNVPVGGVLLETPFGL